MTDVAIIGGSGFSRLPALKITQQRAIRTPFGETSAPLTFGLFNEHEVVFLPRHGEIHSIPPHKVNYQANLWALQHVGIDVIIAIAAVGGIRADMTPGAIAIPDQIIDYTHGRSNTFFADELTQVSHIDFTEPYCEDLRRKIIASAELAGIDIIDHGTYGATQGPRLETAMEINKMERDGCDIVGMTGMPEAALARELEICYACCAVIANRAAGRGDGPITMDEIEKNLLAGMERVRAILSSIMKFI